MREFRIERCRGIILGVAIMVLTGCHKRVVPGPGQFFLRQGYTCCNLHAEGDWISDGNYAGLPMIPAGKPVKVLSYGGNWAEVNIGGAPYRLGHDYGRAQETLEQWVAKIVVPSDPKAKIAKFSPAVREAVRLGKVVPGMTKSQAIISLGYPLTSENPSLDAPMWRYWISSFEEYQLLWSQEGVLQEVIAAPTVKTRVLHQPVSRSSKP